MAFAACYCGGYSATAHKMGRGNTEAEAIQDVIALWNRRAQPAEAEGVEVVGWLHGYAKAVSSDPVVVSGWLPECVEPLMTVAQHQRILSAVTAERDRLQSELDALSWEIASPNISYALRDQLLGQLAGDHEPEEILCVEDFYSWLANAIDNIRAEHRKAEGGQPVRVFASAAMAAKEA